MKELFKDKVKTEEEIIDDCIAAIKAGHWKCGVLQEDRAEVKVGINGYQKPEVYGCALGLVSIHGNDDVKHAREVVDGIEYRVAEYPRAESPEGVKNAVKALASVLPKEFIEDLVENEVIDPKAYEQLESNTSQDLIIAFNDDECSSPEDALKWFEAAAKHLKEEKLKED